MVGFIGYRVSVLICFIGFIYVYDVFFSFWRFLYVLCEMIILDIFFEWFDVWIIVFVYIKVDFKLSLVNKVDILFIFSVIGRYLLIFFRMDWKKMYFVYR